MTKPETTEAQRFSKQLQAAPAPRNCARFEAFPAVTSSLEEFSSVRGLQIPSLWIPRSAGMFRLCVSADGSGPPAGGIPGAARVWMVAACVLSLAARMSIARCACHCAFCVSFRCWPNPRTTMRRRTISACGEFHSL